MEPATLSGLDTLDLVRDSCAWAVSTSPNVRISDAGIEAFAASLVTAPPETRPAPGLPLTFESLDHEIDLLTTLQLVNFGSGYRHELHAATGNGAWDTMQRGVLALHITGRRPDAAFLASVTLADVSETWGIPLDRDVEVLPGIRQAMPGALAPLARLVVRACNEAGQVLRNRGFDGWADCFRSWARGVAARGGGRPTAAAFVQFLAETFPPFADHAVVDRGAAAPATDAAPPAPGEALPPGTDAGAADAAPPARRRDVWLLKKAQVCAARLAGALAARAPELFEFPDLARLTAMADNVLPAVLRAAGVLELAPALAAAVDAREALPAGGAAETDLRAAAVVACSRIVARVHALAAEAGGGEGAGGAAARAAALTEAALDEHLWAQGKEPGLRGRERHAAKGTYFY